MKTLRIIKYLLIITSLVFIFINWKIAIVIFVIGTLFHAIPLGPSFLLSAISGYLMIGGIVYLFMEWKIGISLIIVSILVAKFRVYGDKANIKYYQKHHKAK